MLLMAVAMVLIVGVAVDVAQFCPDGDFENPTLANPDSYRLFTAALQLYNGEEITVIMAYRGIPALLSAIWHITGITIFAPLLLSVLLTLAAIALTSGIARHILPHLSQRYHILAMALCAACCYYVGCGMLILKEPYLFFGVSLAIYAMAARCWWCFAIAVAVIAPVRDGVLYYFLLVLPLFISRKDWKPAAVGIAIVFAGLLLGELLTIENNTRYIDGTLGNTTFTSDYLANPNHSTFNSIFADYYSSPLWLRVLMLPVTCGVQFLVPFPFDFTKYWDFGYTQSYSQFTFPWYIMGGILLFFIYRMIASPRREPLWRWGVLAIISFVVPAYMFAGSVSRYWLPFMPLYAVLITATIQRLTCGCRRQFAIFYSAYLVLLVAALIAAALMM